MKSDKLPLKESHSLEEGSQIVLRELLSRALSAAATLTEESEPEILHRFRVSLRSLRSYLNLMKGVFTPQRQKGLAAELGVLAKATNRLRDLDVLLLRLADYSLELSHLSTA